MRHVNTEAHTAMQMLRVPALAGVTAAAINAMVFNNTEFDVNAAFAGAVFAGNVLADQVVKRFLPKSDLKNLEVRAVEIGGSTALAYALNRYIINSEAAIMAMRMPVQTVGMIAVSRAAAEYISSAMPV